MTRALTARTDPARGHPFSSDASRCGMRLPFVGASKGVSHSASSVPHSVLLVSGFVLLVSKHCLASQS